jgi:hypothetical protein
MFETHKESDLITCKNVYCSPQYEAVRNAACYGRIRIDVLPQWLDAFIRWKTGLAILSLHQNEFNRHFYLWLGQNYHKDIEALSGNQSKPSKVESALTELEKAIRNNGQ